MCMIPIQDDFRKNALKQGRTITVNLGRGFITLSTVLGTELKAEAGHKIIIAQDDETGSWDLSEPQVVPQGARGGVIYNCGNQHRHGSKFVWRFCNNKAAQGLCSVVGASKGATFIVAQRAKIDNGIRYFRIITEKPIKVSNDDFNL